MKHRGEGEGEGGYKHRKEHSRQMVMDLHRVPEHQSALYHPNLHLAFHCKHYPNLGSKATCPEAQFNLGVLA